VAPAVIPAPLTDTFPLPIITSISLCTIGACAFTRLSIEPATFEIELSEIADWEIAAAFAAERTGMMLFGAVVICLVVSAIF
jgi:hypothetical protein